MRRSLDGAPAILPVGEMALRRQLEHWFESHNVQPRIVAEVEDSALLTDLGAQGLGFIPIYSAVLDEIERSRRFKTIGIANGLRMEVFAITAQRRLQHPGVAAGFSWLLKGCRAWSTIRITLTKFGRSRLMNIKVGETLRFEHFFPQPKS